MSDGMIQKCGRCKKLRLSSGFSLNPKTGKTHNWCDECRAKPIGKQVYYEYFCNVCGQGGGISCGKKRKTVWVCHQCYIKKQKAIKQARKGDGAIKKELIRIRGERCEYCGTVGKVKMHHIKEVSEGGESTPDNLLLVCHECHKRLHPHGWAKRARR